MSDGFDVLREAAPGPDDVATQYLRHADERPLSPASEGSCRSDQGGGRDAEMGDGCVLPVLTQPASTAPTYPTCGMRSGSGATNVTSGKQSLASRSAPSKRQPTAGEFLPPRPRRARPRDRAILAGR